MGDADEVSEGVLERSWDMVSLTDIETEVVADRELEFVLVIDNCIEKDDDFVRSDDWECVADAVVEMEVVHEGDGDANEAVKRFETVLEKDPSGLAVRESVTENESVADRGASDTVPEMLKSSVMLRERVKLLLVRDKTIETDWLLKAVMDLLPVLESVRVLLRDVVGVAEAVVWTVYETDCE